MATIRRSLMPESEAPRAPTDKSGVFATMDPEVLRQIISLGILTAEDQALAESYAEAHEQASAEMPEGQHVGPYRAFVGPSWTQAANVGLNQALGGYRKGRIRREREDVRDRQQEAREVFADLIRAGAGGAGGRTPVTVGPAAGAPAAPTGFGVTPTGAGGTLPAGSDGGARTFPLTESHFSESALDPVTAARWRRTFGGLA